MARVRCDQQISHRREALEEAILGHLGPYSDPAMVRELLVAQGQESDAGGEAELTRISGRLAELERSFLNDLDRVDRRIMTDPEYLKRQEVQTES